MILREEHAKTSICPMLSRGAQAIIKCQTKECMMWVYVNSNPDAE